MSSSARGILWRAPQGNLRPATSIISRILCVNAFKDLLPGVSPQFLRPGASRGGNFLLHLASVGALLFPPNFSGRDSTSQDLLLPHGPSDKATITPETDLLAHIALGPFSSCDLHSLLEAHRLLRSNRELVDENIRYAVACFRLQLDGDS